MKNQNDLVRDLMDTVKALSTYAENDTVLNAVLVITLADGQLTAAVAGSPDTLAKMTAHAMNADGNMSKIISAAAEAAPFIAMMSNDEPCDCSNCTERRRQAAANPSVN